MDIVDGIYYSINDKGIDKVVPVRLKKEVGLGLEDLDCLMSVYVFF